MAREIGESFANYYYGCLDRNRAELQNLYVLLVLTHDCLAGLLNDDMGRSRDYGYSKYSTEADGTDFWI